MIVNGTSLVQLVIQIRNGIRKHVNASVKVIVHAKKIIVWILAHVFVEMVILKKCYWWFKSCVWWNYICYGYCISKYDKYYISKCYEYYDNVLIDEKSHKNILIHDISYKPLIGAKPLHIRVNKIDGFIKIYDGTRYLVLFDPEEHDAIYNRIRYLISQKSCITNVFSHCFTKIKLILMILCL